MGLPKNMTTCDPILAINQRLVKNCFQATQPHYKDMLPESALVSRGRNSHAVSEQPHCSASPSQRHLATLAQLPAFNGKHSFGICKEMGQSPSYRLRANLPHFQKWPTKHLLSSHPLRPSGCWGGAFFNFFFLIKSLSESLN